MPRNSRRLVARLSSKVRVIRFSASRKSPSFWKLKSRRAPLTISAASCSLFQLVASPRPTMQGTSASLEPIWMEMISALRRYS